MQGAPLVRLLLLVFLLVLFASGFHIITRKKASTLDSDTKSSLLTNTVVSSEQGREARFELRCSTAYRLITLRTGRSQLDSVQISQSADETGTTAAFSARGKIVLYETEAPLFLKVDWLNEETAPKFVKLILELPGEPTFIHVFDGKGSIEDLVELPF